MDDRRKRGLRSRNTDKSEDERTVRPSAAPASGGGGIFKSAAVAVLRQHRKLMTTGDITRLAVEMGLLKCQGKTPEATMASALYTDVKRKLQKSLFTRPQEGLFGLREWLEEGYYPEGWVGPPDGLGLAPFKRRNNVSTHGSSGAPAAASKSGRAGVRTGPGRSSKSRASRSWRHAASDGEDDDAVDDEDEPLPSSRSHHGAAAAVYVGGPVSIPAAIGEEEDADEAAGEGEEMEAEDEVDEGDEGPAEGQGDGGEDLLGRGAADERGQQHDGQAGTRIPPAASPVRRGSRGRSGGGVADGGMPQDECLSPLHMLGEAAASESCGDMGNEPDMAPPAKRKRPSSITVPERGGGLGSVEGATPKSPYEDSLAALHEIATSPSTFELTSQRELSLRDRDGASAGISRAGGESGSGGSGKIGRTRPRLHVDVTSHGPDLGGPGSRRDSGTPGTALLTDNPLLQGETTPAILLQASPVTTANGQQAMMLRQAPVLVTLPPALASPTAASAGQLDTPALLHVQLPGGAPSELMQTTLITPTGQQLTPFRSNQGAAGQPGRGGLLKTDGSLPSSRPPGRRVSFSGQVGILGPPSAVQPRQPLQSPVTGAGTGTPGQAGAPGPTAFWPPRLTPAQVESELAEITRVQTVVERLESKLGNTHPQVGKAWLALSRMYQHISDAERQNGSNCIITMAKASEALRRAWAVCRACAESCGTALQCEDAFRYLTARTSQAVPETTAKVQVAASGDEAKADDNKGPSSAALIAVSRGDARDESGPTAGAPDAAIAAAAVCCLDARGQEPEQEPDVNMPEAKANSPKSGVDAAADAATS